MNNKYNVRRCKINPSSFSILLMVWRGNTKVYKNKKKTLGLGIMEWKWYYQWWEDQQLRVLWCSVFVLSSASVVGNSFWKVLNIFLFFYFKLIYFWYFQIILMCWYQKWVLKNKNYYFNVFCNEKHFKN